MIRFLILITLTITGCASPTTSLENDSEYVQVVLRTEKRLDHCKWLGHVTGTEGHWYNYLFFSNDLLIDGAMNELRNKTKEMGGNVVLLAPTHDFATSITYSGTVFHCKTL